MSLERLQCASHWNFRSSGIGGYNERICTALPLPLTSNKRCLADILDRSAAPFDASHNRFVIGRFDRVENCFRIVDARSAFQDIDGNFEQRMLEADRLRPRLAG